MTRPGGWRPRSDTVRAVTLFAMNVAVLVAIAATPVSRWVNQDSVRVFVARTGWWGPAALFALCVLLPLVMVPRWPLAVAGGILYGTLWGGLLANAGSALGAVVGFLFARYMARAFVVRRLGRHNETFDRLTRRYGVRILIALRAIPFTNNSITNALAGVSEMRLVPYALASFVGMIPSSFMYSFMGKVAKQPSRGLLVLFGGTFLVFSLVTLALGRRVLHRLAARSAPTPDATPPEGEPPPSPDAPLPSATWRS